MTDLICKDLCMTFRNATTGAKVEALKDINFELKEGEILTVLGPSGFWVTGKSRGRVPNAAWSFSRVPCSNG
jgi:ABC-type oligopeptide transport system ATPase subunit